MTFALHLLYNQEVRRNGNGTDYGQLQDGYRGQTRHGDSMQGARDVPDHSFHYLRKEGQPREAHPLRDLHRSILFRKQYRLLEETGCRY